MSAADIVPQLAVDNIGPKEFRGELGRAEGMRMLLGVPQDKITVLVHILVIMWGWCPARSDSWKSVVTERTVAKL